MGHGLKKLTTFNLEVKAMSPTSSSLSYDDDYEDYYDYDDFGLGSCGAGGGGDNKKRMKKRGGGQNSGGMYSSKHVRLVEARRDGGRNKDAGGRKRER